MEELFSYKPDGLPGDEDNGSMGGWYVLSALGIYPLCPGVPEYVLGSPFFRKASIHLENGQIVEIEALDNAAHRPYVGQVWWNGEAYSKLYVIVEFISKDSKYYGLAVYNDIMNKAQTLIDFPHRGRIVPEMDDPELREVFVHRYRMIYQIQNVIIKTVVHGAREGIFE